MGTKLDRPLGTVHFAGISAVRALVTGPLLVGIALGFESLQQKSNIDFWEINSLGLLSMR